MLRLVGFQGGRRVPLRRQLSDETHPCRVWPAYAETGYRARTRANRTFAAAATDAADLANLYSAPSAAPQGRSAAQWLGPVIRPPHYRWWILAEGKPLLAHGRLAPVGRALAHT
jgi:hypothetical protein